MQPNQNYWAPRPCLRPPPDVLIEAAETLKEGVSAHLNGRFVEASGLIASTNTADVKLQISCMWGSPKQYPEQVEILRLRDVENMPEKLPKAKQRMPNAAVKRALIKRDGYVCRYCSLPVIPAGVRKYLHALYPDALPWGVRDVEQHAAFQALWLQYEHVTPASYGGDCSLENMIIACAGCNFGKYDSHLRELGLTDPRDRAPVKSDWQGLTNVADRVFL